MGYFGVLRGIEDFGVFKGICVGFGVLGGDGKVSRGGGDEEGKWEVWRLDEVVLG